MLKAAGEWSVHPSAVGIYRIVFQISNFPRNEIVALIAVTGAFQF
jgi:hypothetical protein